MALIDLVFTEDGRPFARGRWAFVPTAGMRVDLELPIGAGRRERRSFVVHEACATGSAVPGESDREPVVSVRPGVVRIEVRMLPPDLSAFGPAPADPLA